MLTSDLAMSWRRGDKIRPRYLDPKEGRYVQAASDLVALFGEHAGRERRELEEALDEYVGTGTDYRVLRGLIKLLFDRCRFETAVELDPVEVRRALFLKAREFHPLKDGDAARAEVAEAAARELACAPELLLKSLYADLPAEQKLLEFETVGASELIDLYNLAQAQALLYRCVEMRLSVEPQRAEGYRALFGAIKAYRLIHTIKGDAASGYEVRLNGPVSMFHRSQKYGVQMAVFLPALLLCAGWRMRAEVNTRQGAFYFELDSRQTTLRTHYVEEPGYANPVTEKFVESWERAATTCELEPGTEVIGLGEGALIPDFVITHPTGRQFFLEILGFWTPQHLSQRLAEFRHLGMRNFVLAAWEELRGTREPLRDVPPNVILFKKNLDPSIVELTVDRLVREEA
jgi:predicted nuclease of restriction endonuclease-like RecB superfamily